MIERDTRLGQAFRHRFSSCERPEFRRGQIGNWPRTAVHAPDYLNRLWRQRPPEFHRGHPVILTEIPAVGKHEIGSEIRFLGCLSQRLENASTAPIPRRCLCVCHHRLVNGYDLSYPLSALLAAASSRTNHSGSLTIGSGSSDPAVDTRRRECKLPASAVSTPLPARFCTIGPPISASLLPPRERQNAAPKTSVFRHRYPRSAENSPPRCPDGETTSSSVHGSHATLLRAGNGRFWQVFPNTAAVSAHQDQVTQVPNINQLASHRPRRKPRLSTSLARRKPAISIRNFFWTKGLRNGRTCQFAAAQALAHARCPPTQP